MDKKQVHIAKPELQKTVVKVGTRTYVFCFSPTLAKLVLSDLWISVSAPDHLVVTKISDRLRPLSRMAIPTLSSFP